MAEARDMVMLGDFLIGRRLGVGGMGEVWAGTHRRTQSSVAIKVITGGRFAEQKWLDSFRAEVQAVAMMNHPGIIGVYDYGFIPREIEELSLGRFGADTPYLVMEFADKGCLDDILSPTFAQIRRLLGELLAALAHAHARGVTHLDLKPANVLLARDGEGRARVKLSDFGIAFDAGKLSKGIDTKRFQTMSGTPAYMAPEQIMSYWRDYGPWTDLYALGCMVWEMCVGEVPFEAASLLLLVQKHLEEDPPTFQPRMQVPEGFELWLRRLLAKAPRHRFQCAAEALYELEQLEQLEDSAARWRPLAFKDAFAPRQEPLGGTLQEVDEKETAALVALRAPASTPSMLFGDTMQGEILGQGSARSATTMSLSPINLDRKLPFPESWREAPTGSARDARAAIPVAGLGLWGFREPGFVDREHARDVIWRLLGETREQGGERLLVLTGPAGVGKSRLVQWMSRRANEVGAFRVMRATYSEHGGLFDGVEGMLRREFGLVELTREKARARLTEMLSFVSDVRREEQELEATEFIDFLFPSGDGEGAATRRAPRARWALVMRMLERLSSRQPLLVCLEDMHLSSESLSLARHILETKHGDLNALFVCTSLPVSGVVDAKRARALLDLLDMPSCEALAVEPLEPMDQRELIAGFISLDDDLVERLVEQTGGNPTFAIQLVSSWIERGTLVASEQGYRLDPQVVTSAASDISALCELRLENVIRETSLPEDDCWLGLELAASLGGEVERREWFELCHSRRLRGLELLLTRLVDAGIVIARDSRWMFSPHAYVDALRERVIREGRRGQVHGMIADWLLEQGPTDASERARVLSHLIETPRLEMASRLLLELVPSISSDQSQEFARHVIERLNEVRGDDALELRLKVELGGELTAMLYGGDLATVGARLDALERGPHAAQVAADLDFVLLKASLFIYEEKFEEARALLEPYCRDEHGEVANIKGAKPQTFNKMLRRFGEVCHYLGESADALEILDEAARQALGAGIRYDYAWVSYSRASVLLDTERLDEGIDALQHTMQVMQQQGDRLGLSTCADLMGIYYYEQGDYSRACGYFRRSMVHADACQDAGAWISRENLARTLLKVQRYEESLELARMIEREHAERGRDVIFLHHVHDIILTCIAGMGLWERWDVQWTKAKAEIAALEAEYDPSAEGFELLADLLLERGEFIRAAELLDLLEARWRELDAGDALERIAEKRALIPARG